VRLLDERGRSVAVAEWATDGLVSQWLAEAAAHSDCLKAGIIIRDRAALTNMLGFGVESEAIAKPETARAMAQAVEKMTGADFGLGIAAFPSGGPQVPDAASANHIDMSGSLHVALARSDNVRVKSFPVASHPAITKARSAKQALNMLRLVLINHETM
jgi:nicotinamide mononucleotide (NMN) deamidase PncC